MIKLRQYQKDCVSGIYNGFSRGDKKLAVVIPTGGGKSAIMGKVSKDFLDKRPNERVVILSHLGLLTTQTGNRFKLDWGVETGVLQGDNYPSKKSRCVISTMQSFRLTDKLIRWASTLDLFAPSIKSLKVGMVLIDEAHFATCDSYQDIMNMFPDAYIIGFTATPFKANKLMTNVFDSVAYSIPMQRLIDEGYLVKPKINLTPFDTSDQAEMFGMMLRVYKDKHKGEKMVVYLKTIEEAELCRNIFELDGIKASAVTSKLTGDTRDRILADYKTGNGVDVLTTVDVLTAGFDSPNLQVIMMPYKVGSVTIFLQRIGRGLRPCKELNKKHCDIYVGSTSPGIKEGFWEKITKQMINQGRTDYDNLQDIVDFGENDYSKEEYTWTIEVVNMANKAKALGLDNLHAMIVEKRMPTALLQSFVTSPPTIQVRSQKPPTEAQQRMINSMGITDALTKNEASNIIRAKMKSEGRKPNPIDVVKHGRHKGKHYAEVPHAYWNIIQKKPSSELAVDYRAYKARRSNK